MKIRTRTTGGIEIITRATGVIFDDCYRRRVVVEVEGTSIPFIALDDLLLNKKAAGRAKDAADVEGLTTGD